MPDFRTATRVVTDTNASYTAEARRVQRRAERFEPSVVRLGQIVFFSTETGDAWMLDARDGEAAYLAREGEAERIPIEEDATKFAVAWEWRWRIVGNLFIVAKSGAESAILGYPTREIQRLVDEQPIEARTASVDTGATRERLQRTGRNDPCPCGSGKKYKKCCLPGDEAALRTAESNGGRKKGSALGHWG